MIKLEGVVKKTKATEFTTKDGTPLVKHELTLDVNGKSKTILKYTKPNTTFAPESGTRVVINAEEQSDKYGNVQYKVDSKPENFILLDQSRKEPEVKQVYRGETATNTKINSSTYDPNGAKRGNAITNAITLLVHNKGKESITNKDSTKLLELARMVYSVSTELENNNNSTTSEEKVHEEDDSPFN